MLCGAQHRASLLPIDRLPFELFRLEAQDRIPAQLAQLSWQAHAAMLSPVEMLQMPNASHR